MTSTAFFETTLYIPFTHDSILLLKKIARVVDFIDDITCIRKKEDARLPLRALDWRAID